MKLPLWQMLKQAHHKTVGLMVRIIIFPVGFVRYVKMINLFYEHASTEWMWLEELFDDFEKKNIFSQIEFPFTAVLSSEKELRARVHNLGNILRGAKTHFALSLEEIPESEALAFIERWKHRLAAVKSLDKYTISGAYTGGEPQEVFLPGFLIPKLREVKLGDGAIIGISLEFTLFVVSVKKVVGGIPRRKFSEKIKGWFGWIGNSNPVTQKQALA